MSKVIVLLTVVAPLWLAIGELAFGAAGSVSGTVSVAGAYPRPQPLPVFKNRTFCGPTVPNETLLIGFGGALRNAVVLLRPLNGKAATQPGYALLDNKHCAFTPHVQVVPLGSELMLKNSDRILHAVHARMGRETLFNVGLPRWRQVTKRLDRAGVVRIDCDVLHTWMSAAVVVTDTPYFALTDEHGRFSIHNLPSGAYGVEVWHERLGALHQVLSVDDQVPNARLEAVYAVQKGR